MSAPWRRSTLVLCTLAALALGGLGAAVADGYTASVTVTRDVTAGPLPDGFVGLAVEFSTIPLWTDDGAQPVNPVLVQLIRNLDPQGRPVIRIGGQSTDRAWWPVAGQAKPLGVTYALSRQWTHAAHLLAKALNARLIPGVNLEANRPLLDRVEARHLVAGIGRKFIDAIEIGNEPDLYPGIPWYKQSGSLKLPWYSHDGTPVYSRPSTYSPADFAADWSRVRAVIPKVPIAGPETSVVPWISTFTQDFLSPGSQLRILTSHAYGLNNCVTTPTAPAYPSVPNLLSQYASRTLFGSGLQGFVGLAHRDGGSYRIDEMGSITCNGKHGVSDTMASALWLIDGLFALASDHIDGVNLHTFPNSDNGLFDFSDSGSSWSAAVHPLYYGALMFAQAAPPGSQLLHVAATGPAELRSWATSGPGPVTRVMLINDSLDQRASVSITPPAGLGAATATVERLTAPSAYATGHISLGGRTFGAQTTTGLLLAPVPQSATPTRSGFRVTLPAASALLLTLTPPPAQTPTPTS